MSAANSPRVWIAAVGVLGFLATLAVSLMTVAGGVLAIGVWKGGIDYRVTAVETASKEQIAALSISTDKQIAAVASASKEMVAGLEQSASKRLDTIERDRSERIQEATRWRAEQGAITTRLETLITGQQRQLDLLDDTVPNRRQTRK